MLRIIKNTGCAVLLYVLTPEEYSEGHIPANRNIPLKTLDKVKSIVENKDIEFFVYCYSDARSSQTASAFKQMGYNRVNNIGGILSCRGKVER